jgi:hypothetical protein
MKKEKFSHAAKRILSDVICDHCGCTHDANALAIPSIGGGGWDWACTVCDRTNRLGWDVVEANRLTK